MSTIKNINIELGDEYFVTTFSMSDGVACKVIGVFNDEALQGGRSITVTEATPRSDDTEALCEKSAVAILGAVLEVVGD